MIITDDDKKLIRKLIEIKNRGYYCSSDVLKNLYNRVFETNWAGTSCSSCMRAKVTELEKALRQWEADEAKKAASGAATEEEPQDNERGGEPTEEKKNKRGRKPKKANGE